MEKSEALLLKEAKKIIIHELSSYTPKTTFNSRAVKHLRKIFLSNCMDEIGTRFTGRIGGYMANKSVYVR
jgi:ribosomal protein L17